MKSFTTEIEGRTLTGLVQKVGGRLWIHFNGRTFSYEPEAQKQKRRSESGHRDPSRIKAPMTGKVTKVAAKKGRVVAVGEVLVVLEAMKMEYTLKAEAGGTVVEVEVNEGEQVRIDQLLVTLNLVSG